VTGIQDTGQSGLRINGGFFVFKRGIFRYIREGEDLVAEPFQRLLSENELLAYRYDGFWLPMDTFKDKQRLDEMYARGNAVWEVWKSAAASPEPSGVVSGRGAELKGAGRRVARPR
jgi:glucose-1-phosphate cytidylyltransferase